MSHGERLHPVRENRPRENFLPDIKVCLDSHYVSIDHSYGFGTCSDGHYDCWDLGRTNSLTSARRGNGLGYIRISVTPPRRLVFWDGAPSPSSGIRAMPRT